MRYIPRVVLVLLCSVATAFGQLSNEQNFTIDSLQRVIDEAGTHDSTIVKLLYKWDLIIYRHDEQLDFELNERMNLLCDKNLEKELGKMERDFFLSKKGRVLNNLGLIAKGRADYVSSVQYYLGSLAIKTKAKDSMGIANTLNNIGNVYFNQGEYNDALVYHNQALSIRQSIDHKIGIATSLNNIANSLQKQKKSVEARKYYEMSRSLSEEIGDSRGVAKALSNIGAIHATDEEFDLAIDYYYQSLVLYRALNDEPDLAGTWKNLGIAYFGLEKWELARVYSDSAIVMADRIGSFSNVREAANVLYQYYRKKGNSKEALAMYERYTSAVADINSIKNQKEVLRIGYKIAYEKKAVADSLKNLQVIELKNEQVKRKNVEIREKKYQLYITIGAIILLIAIAGYIFQRFRSSKLQNELIEKQKKLDMSLVISDNKMRHGFEQEVLERLQEFEGVPAPELKMKLKTFVLDIKNQLKTEERLSYLTDNIDHIHSEINEQITENFTELNESEREICHLIRLNLSIKEIADLRKTSPGAIKVARHRIKKKLNIGDQNLDSYIKENML